MSGPDADRETEAIANELYWSSEHSVNHIAEELDLSKGTLYGLIRPRPAGLACPSCDEEVVFANRTAKERGLVACPLCGWEGDEADAEPDGFGDEGAVALPELVDEVADPPPASTAWGTARTRTVVGGALLGAAAGLAMVLWTRRR